MGGVEISYWLIMMVLLSFVFLHEIDSDNSTVTTLRHPGSTSHDDRTQLSVSAAELKRFENHATWHYKQTDAGGNGNSVSRTAMEGSWLASSSGCVSQHRLQDLIDDRKSGSVWSTVFPGQLAAHSTCPTPRSSNTKSDQVQDLGEKGKKAEASPSCRLFGIELINHSKSPVLTERAADQPNSTPNEITEAEQNSNLPKISKERKLGLLQVPPKEIQHKQNSSTSSRSRTKVNNIRDLLYSLFTF